MNIVTKIAALWRMHIPYSTGRQMACHLTPTLHVVILSSVLRTV